jgi:hypothetical protein
MKNIMDKIKIPDNKLIEYIINPLDLNSIDNYKNRIDELNRLYMELCKKLYEDKVLVNQDNFKIIDDYFTKFIPKDGNKFNIKDKITGFNNIINKKLSHDNIYKIYDNKQIDYNNIFEKILDIQKIISDIYNNEYINDHNILFFLLNHLKNINNYLLKTRNSEIYKDYKDMKNNISLNVLCGS